MPVRRNSCRDGLSPTHLLVALPTYLPTYLSSIAVILHAPYDVTHIAPQRVTTHRNEMYCIMLYHLCVNIQVTGEHAKDIVRIGDTVQIIDQVFAQATHLDKFQTCEAEAGIMGLGFSMISSHQYPSILSNLQTTLLKPYFSLYLDVRSDYPADTSNRIGDKDKYGNLEFGHERPTSTHSEMVFGGVNQRHYEGCITWHSLGQFQDNMGDTFEGYWDFALSDVRVGGKSLNTYNLALVDSGSTYLVGPQDAIAQIAKMNSATCIAFDDENNPKKVDCDSASGFDDAIVNCNQAFLNIEFVADDAVYVLEKEDLLLQIDPDDPTMCLLRIAGSDDIPVSEDGTQTVPIW
uniref:Peptidase A1 domain-containing protein n=1 Tax=Craspedostauros australis TaxID=1486917 RepID=A0A7R9ZQ28_9STRA|mmetsp:Transcript_2646/g.7350  ORF Transcript_2646/g.7350 Transcript_2646/m.7350 type:complete len:348 (+) Transcript_2646:885-1928(+)